MDGVEDIGDPSQQKLEKTFANFLAQSGEGKKAKNDKRPKAKS